MRLDGERFRQFDIQDEARANAVRELLLGRASGSLRVEVRAALPEHKRGAFDALHAEKEERRSRFGHRRRGRHHGERNLTVQYQSRPAGRTCRDRYRDEAVRNDGRKLVRQCLRTGTIPCAARGNTRPRGWLYS